MAQSVLQAQLPEVQAIKQFDTWRFTLERSSPNLACYTSMRENVIRGREYFMVPWIQANSKLYSPFDLHRYGGSISKYWREVDQEPNKSGQYLLPSKNKKDCVATSASLRHFDRSELKTLTCVSSHNPGHQALPGDLWATLICGCGCTGKFLTAFCTGAALLAEGSSALATKSLQQVHAALVGCGLVF